ncbi:MAG: hypothetical protein GT600_08800 [Bacteroidales bacterium]|nr:hypothetical protein [Bacteroidales bacterium]
MASFKGIAYGMGVFLVSTLFFYSLNSGISCTNDGSHFALVNSMVEDHSFKIGRNVAYSMHDSAIYKGEYYSDRSPGWPLFLYGFYWMTLPIKPFLMDIRTDDYLEGKTQSGDLRRISLLMLAPAAVTAFLLLSIFFFLRSFEYNVVISSVTAFLLVMGTISMRYGTVLYSHSLMCLLVLASNYFLIKYAKGQNLWHLGIGIFFLSYSLITEHISLFLCLPIGIYLLVRCRSFIFKMRPMIILIASGLIPLLFFFWYNYHNFGHPLSIAQSHQVMYSFYKDISKTFFGSDPVENFKRLLIGTTYFGDRFYSLLYFSPFLIVIFSLLIFRPCRTLWPETMLLSSEFIITLLAVSCYSLPTGGNDMDYRHMLFAVPLLAPLLAESLVRIRDKLVLLDRRLYMTALIIYLFICAIAIDAQFNHIRTVFQEELPSVFCNVKPALTNCTLLLLLGLAYLGILLAVANYIKVVKNKDCKV